MLARRFTIVCLLTALFGMFFASVVAQSDAARTARHGATHWSCSFSQSFAC